MIAIIIIYNRDVNITTFLQTIWTEIAIFSSERFRVTTLAWCLLCASRLQKLSLIDPHSLNINLLAHKLITHLRC